MTSHDGELINPAEMYLRIILELEEEDIPAMSARILEKVGRSAPTVSRTIGRMQRDGLLTVTEDRRLKLSGKGRKRAVAVMRKHRLAELLLVQILGVDYELAHEEACLLQHVMSESAERAVYEQLGRPTHSPSGMAIPGLKAIGGDSPTTAPRTPKYSLAFAGLEGKVVVSRIFERIQARSKVLKMLHNAQVVVGSTVLVSQRRDAVSIESATAKISLPWGLASGVFVTVQVTRRSVASMGRRVVRYAVR